MSDYRGPTEIGHYSSPRGASYTMTIEGHDVQVYVTAKRKQIRVFVNHDEWKKADQ